MVLECVISYYGSKLGLAAFLEVVHAFTSCYVKCTAYFVFKSSNNEKH